MKRSPVKLSAALRKSLETYALAASMSGAGLLMSAPQSEAEVVYTPTNVVIALNSSYAIDLNHDGIVDFTITEKRCLCTSFEHESVVNYLYVQPTPGAGVAQSAFGVLGYVGVLPRGTRIPNSQNRFSPRTVSMLKVMGKDETYYYGYWTNQSHKYFGLAFRIDGQTQYGWARMTVRYNFGTFAINPRLEGFAYESEAGKPIVTGDMGLAADTAAEKPTLGMLAAGAVGLSVWRKQP